MRSHTRVRKPGRLRDAEYESRGWTLLRIYFYVRFFARRVIGRSGESAIGGAARKRAHAKCPLWRELRMQISEITLPSNQEGGRTGWLANLIIDSPGENIFRGCGSYSGN